MFSDRLTKAERWPVINLFVLAGLLVVLCQLVAMALVVDSKMDKSDVRNQRDREHVAAMADCPDRMQLDVRPLRHGCIQQVLAARDAAGFQDAVLRPAQAWAQGGEESMAHPALMSLNLRSR